MEPAPFTPGASLMSCVKSRPFKGMSCTALFGITSLVVEVSVSSDTAVLATSTVCDCEATFRTSRRAVTLPTSTGTLSIIVLSNPGWITITWYSPKGRSGNVNSPVFEVVVCRLSPLVELVASTEAPEMAAAVGSFTLPVMPPRKV